jgi:hypothetical protein
MLARPKSVQWEERERVRRQQEEEVKQPLDNCCCAPLIAVAQAMKQLQNANVHRNVVKPSKGSGHVLAAASVAPPRLSRDAAGVASADVVPIEERLFHEADNRDAIRERARRCVSACRTVLVGFVTEWQGIKRSRS